MRVAQPTGNRAEMLSDDELRAVRKLVNDHGLLEARTRLGLAYETMRMVLGGGRLRSDTAQKIRDRIRAQAGAP